MGRLPDPTDTDALLDAAVVPLPTLEPRGAVRADLALAPAAAVLTASLGDGMMNALLERLGLTLPEYLADTGLASRLSPEETAELIDSVLDVLWRGIAAKS